MALGAAFAVSGIIIAVLSFNLTFKNKWLWELFKPEDVANLQGFSTAVQVIAYTMGVVVTALGLFVVPTVLRRKPICVFCYLCWVALAVIVMFVIGSPLIFLYSFRGNSVESFCSANFENVPTRYGQEKAKQLYSFIEHYDDQLQAAQNHMCSKEMCPCAPIDVKKWNAYEKALLLGSVPSRRSKPVSFIPDKRRNFYFKEDGFVETFGQCHDIYKDRDTGSMVEKKLIDTMRVIESALECQGLCKQTLFWFFRPISEGQPPRSCAVALKQTYDDTFGALSLGLYFSIFVGFALVMCSFGLFRKKKSRQTGQDFEEFLETTSHIGLARGITLNGMDKNVSPSPINTAEKSHN